jgi:hypothetical protein
MAYLRTNYRKNETAKPKPAPRRVDPGPAYGTRDVEFENLALKNIAGSITVYRVTTDFIVGLDGDDGPSAE